MGVPDKYFVGYVKPYMIDRKWWRYYLIPIWDRLGKFKEIVDVPIDQAFSKFVSKYMNAFVEKGEMPPATIAPAIFNMLDDYANGAEKIAIRTGDWIAIQNFMREAKAR